MKKTFFYCLVSSVLLTPTIITAYEWLNVVRSIPYSYSKGFHSNLSTIRQWVLLQGGYCEQSQRHILFDNRGRFLGYMANASESKITQDRLNKARENLQKSGRVSRWIEGDNNKFGYPFALNCDQPHADIDEAMKRLFGLNKEEQLWGTWDGMRIGSKDEPVPLLQLVEKVYRRKSKQIQQPVIASEFRHFLAQIIIESGARKNGLSKENAMDYYS